MATLFEDVFEVSGIPESEQKFTHVERIYAKGENHHMDLVLDIAKQLYRLPVGTKFNFMLAKSLRLDGSADDKTFNQTKESSLMDSYEYVMHGKVFHVNESTGAQLEIIASFGGLMMSLKGAMHFPQKISLDDNIYLLIRKGN